MIKTKIKHSNIKQPGEPFHIIFVDAGTDDVIKEFLFPVDSAMSEAELRAFAKEKFTITQKYWKYTGDKNKRSYSDLIAELPS